VRSIADTSESEHIFQDDQRIEVDITGHHSFVVNDNKICLLGWIYLFTFLFVSGETKTCGVVLGHPPVRVAKSHPAYQPIGPTQMADSGGSGEGTGRGTPIRPVTEVTIR
jgi:hypothetical protein